MAKLLRISKEISLPQDAVTQTMAMIGRKGAGKTYLASMVAEQMLDIHAQVVVVDPVGNWWGLRVDADGRTKGKEIFVIGGDHGDVPLVPEAGRRIAQLLVEKGISAVLDVSSFGIGERKRFCADFGEEFFQLKKKKREPVHVFLEEAQLVVPQNIRPDEGRMYSAYEQIVRLGRNYGIGCSLITQRPQSVNKEVFSQVECLCVLQVTGPHERKALEGWVQEVGADRKLIGELPSLQRGEGYVWSPAWLRLYERVHFSKKQTFDASATPEVGKKTQAASLSAVDVDALKRDMADVVEQAEKDDPVALRRKIGKLEQELAKKPQEVEVRLKESVRIQKIEVPAIGKRSLERLEKVMKSIRSYTKKATEANESAQAAAKMCITAMDYLAEEVKKVQASRIDITGDPKVFMPPVSIGIDHATGQDKSAIAVIERKEDGTREIRELNFLSGVEQRILDAIAWFNAFRIEVPTRVEVAFIAKYSPLSSNYVKECGALRSKGLVNYPTSKTIVLTPLGSSLARSPSEVPSNAALHERVYGVISPVKQRILRPIIAAGGEPPLRAEVAEVAEYSEKSSNFVKELGSLRSLGLVDYPDANSVKAESILFPH